MRSWGLLGIYGRVSRVPPHTSGSNPGVDEIEQLEELGDDAIIAQQQGAHAPVPRAQVTEESRSIVISDHPAPGSNPPPDAKIPGEARPRRRSERTEKTVVIRDRRQIDELRRQMAAREPRPASERPGKGLALWVIVGVAAFVTGGVVALFATRDETVAPTAPGPAAAQLALTKPPAPLTSEPPAVSIDELPIEKK